MPILQPLTTFVPGQTVVPSGKYGNDGAGSRVKISDDDLASVSTTGATLFITVLYEFARGAAQDDDLVAQFAAALENGFDGIITYQVKREDLQTADDCALAAGHILNQLRQEYIEVTIIIRSPIDGWDTGQAEQLLDSVGGVNAHLDIQSVQMEFINTDNGGNDVVKYTVVSSPYPIDPLANIANSINLSTRPNKPSSPEAIPSE